MRVVHIAGLAIQVGPRVRQRCSWCGATLIDHDLTQVCVQVMPGEEPRPPATWPCGELVAVEGEQPQISSLVVHRDGDPLPEGSCARLDPDVTG